MSAYMIQLWNFPTYWT